MFGTHFATDCLVINAPALFRRADFRAWLTDTAAPKFTWHPAHRAEPDQYSDVVVLVEPCLNGEGDQQGAMPGWDALVEHLRSLTLPLRHEAHLMVRLTNLEE